ncbi:MAG: hypothetical protein NTW86_33185, partial [Candidatus Sumerlaeota bacterium]|nr:hypothetical protein [Candidatus Sumerlaeota bacterium]
MKPSWPIWAVLCLAFPIAKVAPAEIHWTGADLARLGGLGARAAPSVKTTQGQSGTAFEFSDGGIECPMNGALTAAAGAVEIAFQVPDDWPAKEDRALFHVGQEPHTHVTLFFRGGQLIAVYKGDVDHYASISNPAARTWTKGSWHSLQYSWQARGEEVDFFLRVDDRLAGMNTGKLIARWPDRFYIGQRNQGAAPWKGLIESVRLSPRPMALPEAQPGNWTIEVDASKSAGPCYNFWSISNFTSEDMFAQPEMREKIARSHPFMKYVNCVRLLGGRSDGKNEWFKGVDEQGKVVCDFAPLISYLKGIQD